MSLSDTKQAIHEWLTMTFEDPLTEIMAKQDNLTRAQLETFLIDVLAEDVLGQEITYERKAKLRLNKTEVSRGAFNRTLRQAQKNVIRSIYTVLLLGYLGVLATPRLERYLYVSNRLAEFSDKYRKTWKNQKNDDFKEQEITELGKLKKELLTSINELAMPRMLSKREFNKER